MATRTWQRKDTDSMLTRENVRFNEGEMTLQDKKTAAP